MGKDGVKKAVIIGSGIAGLASAIRLKCKGYVVEVYESNSYAGGKLTEIQVDGYRFDAGPSVFTLPELVTELFELAGKNAADYFTYKKLERTGNYFYPDGTHFIAYTNPADLARELKMKLGVFNPEPFFKYLKKSAKLYNLLAPIFIEKSLHSWKNFLSINTLKGLLHYRFLNLKLTMNQANRKWFTEKKLVQYFNRYATYNGSSPHKAPALLNLIPHLEHNLGLYFPANGMHQITTSLVKLAEELGVKFHYNSPVQEIITDVDKRKKKVEGIMVNQKFVEADIVVCNADVNTAYNKLLPFEPKPEKILTQEKSSSALIFYWGINKKFPELDLHNIMFSAEYRIEFRHIFSFRSVYYDPTIYINITSKEKPEDAPAGCENWFVMINVPNNKGQNWDQMIAESRRNIIQKINDTLKTNIEEHIVAENILDPRLIEQKTGSVGGALYGNASNSKMAAFFRHKNFSSNVKGLYFCGGSVHPGGGIPLCLNSAKIVSKLIDNNG